MFKWGERVGKISGYQLIILLAWHALWINCFLFSFSMLTTLPLLLGSKVPSLAEALFPMSPSALGMLDLPGNHIGGKDAVCPCPLALNAT